MVCPHLIHVGFLYWKWLFRGGGGGRGGFFSFFFGGWGWGCLGPIISAWFSKRDKKHSIERSTPIFLKYNIHSVSRPCNFFSQTD
jgi:hypothetical protein